MLTSVHASVVQAHAPSAKEDLAYSFHEILGERSQSEWTEVFPDSLSEGWRHPHFDEIKDLEYIPPTEESLRLTQEQVQDFNCGMVTDVPRFECEALVALYGSTNGEDWTDHSNWLQSTTVSNWYGIYIS